MIDDLSATGITGIPSVAEHLADFGRFGDGYFVHATEGEAIVPLPVLDENPRLKEALFTQMQEMGLEPERYIVGNELNSINPITGQPEFFLKKFFRGAKNVLKAVAPIVLPAVLAGTRLGPILGSTAGIGIARALQGKGLDRIASDMFKTAGITTLLSGLSGRDVSDDLNIRRRGGDFLEAAFDPKGKSRFWDPKLFDSGTVAPIEKRGFGPDVEELSEDLVKSGATITPVPGYGNRAPQYSSIGQPGSTITDSDMLTPRLIDPANYQSGSGLLASIDPRTSQSRLIDPANYQAGSPASSISPNEAGFGQSIYEALTPGGMGVREGLQQAFFPAQVVDAEQILGGREAYLGASPANRLAAQELAKGHSKNPGYIRKYLPLTALGLGAAGLFGAFDDPEEPEPVSVSELERQMGPTARDLVTANPTRYRTGIPTYSPVSLSSVSIPTAYGAEGGSVGFPRRIGAIAGRGTGTSDDVPAMLSDGEYVMTAKAVRGAGNGNREKGMRNMYDMMRQFEGQVA